MLLWIILLNWKRDGRLINIMCVLIRILIMGPREQRMVQKKFHTMPMKVGLLIIMVSISRCFQLQSQPGKDMCLVVIGPIVVATLIAII